MKLQLPFRSLVHQSDFRNGIAPRLITYIVVCSSFITLIATGYQLFSDYTRDVHLLEERMVQIKESYLRVLVNSLWMTDIDQTRVLLDGIVRLPDMQYLEIQSAESPWVSVGTDQKINIIRESFPLVYTHQGEDYNLGTLYVVATLEGVYERMFDKVLVILMTQAVKTFVVSLFIFVIVQYLLTRHLSTMADYAHRLNSETLHTPLYLGRNHQEDELEEVVVALNTMRENLKVSYRKLKVQLDLRTQAENELLEYKEHLEEQVADRTAELKASLQEKEVLLQEIHHRVKNNMQVISSLLRLQFRHLKDESIQMALNDLQNRIQAMTLVHEQLYQSHDIASIDFSEFIRSLSNELVRSYLSDQKPITLDVKVDEVRLGVNYAIPCGLIINELVTNALKYAFPENHTFPNNQSGVICIAMQQLPHRVLQLEVRDNGKGLPEDLDPQKSKSMGLRLVSILVQQIKGKYRIEREGGVAFQFHFEVK